ncbi:MAG TPA: ferritin [Candidatus Hydrogenedentes bacterium]|nr:ferritin [Candidatus Hydrogenedentota bacterium]HRT19931.1 ferritin [Candidatus Hydrogenedentota bacterium]HRT64609.1 ferritin [Candidatus Hydrogenedentota bacterium]
MLSDKMLKALNDQITKEFHSAYLYMAMSAYFEGENLPGFAKWMRLQAQEESCHALIFFNYTCERGGKVTLGAVDAPPTTFKSAVDVFEKTLAHEQFITDSINKLMDLAIKESDHATRAMLQWFVTEQVEEEANASQILARLHMMKGGGNGLLMMDGGLGSRTFAVPSPLAGKL